MSKSQALFMSSASHELRTLVLPSLNTLKTWAQTASVNVNIPTIGNYTWLLLTYLTNFRQTCFFFLFFKSVSTVKQTPKSWIPKEMWLAMGFFCDNIAWHFETFFTYFTHHSSLSKTQIASVRYPFHFYALLERLQGPVVKSMAWGPWVLCLSSGFTSY